MRKLILVPLFFFTTLCSEQINHGTFKGKRFNDVWKQFTDVQCNFKYNNSEDMLYMYIYGYTTTAHLLDKEQRAILTSIVNKYFEWNEKAISKEVEIEKTIDIELVVRGVFNLGDEWHWSCKKPSNSIVAKFFSQNTKRHQLVLSFEKIKSCSNSYIDYKPDQLYFDYEEVLIISKLLLQEALDETMKEFEKQESIEDDFN